LQFPFQITSYIVYISVYTLVKTLFIIAEMLIKKLSQQSEVEFNRDTVQVDLLDKQENISVEKIRMIMERL